jgi:AraC-like DNA-binding protein
MEESGQLNVGKSRSRKGASELQDLLEAMTTLVGLPVKLIPFREAFAEAPIMGRGHHLCRRPIRNNNRHGECESIWVSLRERLGRRSISWVWRCPVGLKGLAVPVIIGGVVVALVVCCGFQAGRSTAQRPGRPVVPCGRAGLRAGRSGSRRLLAEEAPVLPRAKVRAIKELLVLFAEKLAHDPTFRLGEKHGREPRCVVCGREYAQTHFDDGASTRDAARLAQVAEAYFCRAFKAASGMTFSEYVACCRVERAKELLATPALRVTEAALAAGFQSIAHFNHTFKRVTGTNPSAYRASLGL